MTSVAENTLNDVRRLIDACIPGDDRNSLTFGELFERYYERHVLIHTRSPKNAYYFYKVHGPRWKDLKVIEITRLMIQEWVDDYNVKSPTAAKRAVDMISATFNWGIKREYITCSNPCKGVDKKRGRSRDRFLSPTELVRFMTALKKEPQIYQDFFSLSLLTGVRRGRVQAMRWDELDFELATWRFENKNDDIHYVPLVPEALQVLIRRKAASDSDWVFPAVRSREGHLKDPRYALERVVKRAGIKNFRIHDLRRTAGSYLAIQGESAYIIGQFLGHRDHRSTAVYARLNLDPVRKAASKMTKNWKKLAVLPAHGVASSPPVIEYNKNDHGARTDIQTPKNSELSISASDQVIIEGKILTALKAGKDSKREMYKRIGTRPVVVNKFELERILNDMIERNLIYRFRNEKLWQFWRYGIAEDPKLTKQTHYGVIEQIVSTRSRVIIQ